MFIILLLPGCVTAVCIESCVTAVLHLCKILAGLSCVTAVCIMFFDSCDTCVLYVGMTLASKSCVHYVV